MKASTIKRALFAAALSCSVFGLPCSAFSQERVEPAKDVSIVSSYLNNLIVHQWVKLDAAGRLTGSVAGLQPGEKVFLANMPVYLISGNSVLSKTVTSADGTFSFSGVTPGTYGIIARDASTFGAFSLNILSSERGSHLPSDVEMFVVTPATDALRILREQSVPGGESVLAASTDSDPLGNSRVYSDAPVVMLSSGALSGKVSLPGVSRDLSDVRVFILKDGLEVAAASVSKDGEFAVGNLRPGIYGMIAAGESGVAAISFEAADSPVRGVNATEKLITAVQQVSVLTTELMPPGGVNLVEVNVNQNEVASSEVPMSPFAGGSPMSGGFGGGGGGGAAGGGVGWGGIAGIAGLATVAAILASEDDPQPVSPIN